MWKAIWWTIPGINGAFLASQDITPLMWQFWLSTGLLIAYGVAMAEDKGRKP